METDSADHLDGQPQDAATLSAKPNPSAAARKRRIGAIAAAMILGGGLLWGAIVTVIWMREEAVRSHCNLAGIAYALHCYHDEHGRFPPAFLRSPDGQPLLSWRVLILPYLEHRELYHEFRLDEPWDSPFPFQLSVTGLQFMNWQCDQGGGGAIDLLMHLAGLDAGAAVRWLEQQLGTSQLAAGKSTADTSAARHAAPAAPRTLRLS